SGIVTATTGLPFNIATGINRFYQGAQGRPDYAPNNPALTVGGITYPACNGQVQTRQPNLWFNPNCFSLQTFGTTGNVGRDTGVGPNLVTADIALLKDTNVKALSEQFNIQFRAEFFNLFNHTNFGLPVIQAPFTGTGTINALAGVIQSTATP